MRSRLLLPVLSAALFAGLALYASPARADLLSVYAAVKGMHGGGSGDAFERFDSPMGFGAEAGFELLGIDIFGEAVIMGSDQYFFSANAGFDLSFGDDFRVDIGLFTGPVFFVYPKSSSAGSVLEYGNLTDNERATLQQAAAAAGYSDLSALDAEFQSFANAEDELDRLTAGWNLARLKFSMEYSILPVLYLGLNAHAGYHLMISGEEVAAGGKNEAVNRFADENSLGGEERDLLRRAAGAEAIDTDSLDGINYNVGLYLKLEI